MRLMQHHISSQTDDLLTVDEIFSVIPDLIFVLDSNYIILEYRAGKTGDLYLPPDEFLGKPMHHVLPESISKLVTHTVDAALRSGGIECVEYQLSVSDNVKWFEARVSHSNHQRFIMLVRDITELKAKQADIQYQANHDSLTDLYNRSFAIDFLTQKLKEAQRKRGMTSVFFIDIDDFKLINDKHGHDAGDKVLIEVGDAIQAMIRNQDLVARFGGDEFMVILDGIATESELVAIANKVTSELANRATQLPCDVSLSIGIASCENGSLSTNELIRYADLAMYESKRQGKRRVSVYKPK